jgi:hypothetical protein
VGLIPFIPAVPIKAIVKDKVFLVMEDFEAGYHRPRTLTVKIGEPTHLQSLQEHPYGIRVTQCTGKCVSRKMQQSWNDIVNSNFFI